MLLNPYLRQMIADGYISTDTVSNIQQTSTAAHSTLILFIFHKAELCHSGHKEQRRKPCFIFPISSAN